MTEKEFKLIDYVELECSSSWHKGYKCPDCEEVVPLNKIKKFVEKLKVLIVAYHGEDIEKLLTEVDKLTGFKEEKDNE